MSNSNIMTKLFAASISNTRNTEIPCVPTTDVNVLIDTLKRAGWWNNCTSRYGLELTKSIQVDKFGELRYDIHIIGGTNLKIVTGFSVCRLLGPSLNMRTGAIQQHTVHGEWKTVKGASVGLSSKYKQAREEFLAKAVKL